MPEMKIRVEAGHMAASQPSFISKTSRFPWNERFANTNRQNVILRAELPRRSRRIPLYSLPPQASSPSFRHPLVQLTCSCTTLA